MKLTRFTPVVLLGLVLALAAAGCKTKTPPVTKLPGSPGAQEGMGPGGTLQPGQGLEGQPSTTGIPANPAGSHAGWNERRDALQADTVHFDFDSSVVRPSEQVKVAAVADYLKSSGSDAVKIEGYCDERGTEEYNRSLGERRALALREVLARLGIDPSRVDTVSFGKDRPADPGHDDAAWRKNRRGEFILLTPPK